MRDRNSGVSSAGDAMGASRVREDGSLRREVSYDEKSFFESFYKSSREREVTDRTTIGSDFSLMEAQFHYNAVENSILRAIARRQPPPRSDGVLAWEMLVKSRGLRLLDLGSGSGHWIEFFRNTLLVTEAVGVDIAEQMIRFLQSKYAADDSVRIVNMDVAGDNFCDTLKAGPFDYISAIGIMFHIVDDDRWRQALGNLARLLQPEGLLFVGGDFGPETRNVQYNKTDTFASWTEYRKAEAEPETVKVNKRVRSLADWQQACQDAGFSILDLVRTDSDPLLRSPENDVLVLGLRG